MEKWAILAISRGIISEIASNSHVDKLNTSRQEWENAQNDNFEFLSLTKAV